VQRFLQAEIRKCELAELVRRDDPKLRIFLIEAVPNTCGHLVLQAWEVFITKRLRQDDGDCVFRG
jgi:hypothetical protein